MLAAAAPRPVQDVSIDYDVCIYPTSKERWPAPRARRRRRARGGAARARRARAARGKRAPLASAAEPALLGQRVGGERPAAVRRGAHAPDRDPAHDKGEPLHGGVERARAGPSDHWHGSDCRPRFCQMYNRPLIRRAVHAVPPATGRGLGCAIAVYPQLQVRLEPLVAWAAGRGGVLGRASRVTAAARVGCAVVCVWVARGSSRAGRARVLARGPSRARFIARDTPRTGVIARGSRAFACARTLRPRGGSRRANRAPRRPPNARRSASPYAHLAAATRPLYGDGCADALGRRRRRVLHTERLTPRQHRL